MHNRESKQKIYNSIVYFSYFLCYAFSIYLQLLGVLPPDPHRGSAPGPAAGLPSPRAPVLFPLSKFLATLLLKYLTSLVREHFIRPTLYFTLRYSE